MKPAATNPTAIITDTNVSAAPTLKLSG